MLTPSEYIAYDALGLAELVRNNEVTAGELVDTAIEVIDRVGGPINALAQRFDDRARAGIAAVPPGSPFAGVPFLVKPMLLTAPGLVVDAASRLAEGSWTAMYDSTLMTRFRDAGFVTVGATTAPEFGVSVSTESDVYGVTRNPWNVDRIAGGSSGGAAAAVAARMVPIAHGNDAGGSIRGPAAVCGIVGLKPTRGRTPMGPDYGSVIHGQFVHFALTRTVRDTAALLDAVEGEDAGAFSYVPKPERPYAEEIRREPSPLRIAVLVDSKLDRPIDPQCRRAVETTARRLESLGHTIVETAPPIDEAAFADAMTKAWVSSLANTIDYIARLLGRTPSVDNIMPMNWKLLLAGRTMTASDVWGALMTFDRVTRSLGRYLESESVDAVLSPTVAAPAPPVEEYSLSRDDMSAQEWLTLCGNYYPFAGLFNATGMPAISLPAAQSSDGLPIGIMLAADQGNEAALLQLAAQLEEAEPWDQRLPPITAAMADGTASNGRES